MLIKFSRMNSNELPLCPTQIKSNLCFYQYYSIILIAELICRDLWFFEKCEK